MKLSIVVTTFNDADIIRRTLLALVSNINILKSSIQDSFVELIIVDGGSSDATIEEINSFLKEYINVFDSVRVIVHDRNYGISKARNDGIKVSSGELVLILDSDIVLPPLAIKHMYEKLVELHMRDSSIVGVKPIISTSPSIYKKFTIGRTLCPTVGASEALLIYSSVIRSNLYNEKLGPPFSSDEDIELGARLLKNGFKICVVGDLVADHVKSLDSLYFTITRHPLHKFYKTYLIVRSYFYSYTQRGFEHFFKSLPLKMKVSYILSLVSLSFSMLLLISGLISHKYLYVAMIVPIIEASVLYTVLTEFATVLSSFYNFLTIMLYTHFALINRSLRII